MSRTEWFPCTTEFHCDELIKVALSDFLVDTVQLWATRAPPLSIQQKVEVTGVLENDRQLAVETI